MNKVSERIKGRLGDLLPLKYGKSLPAAVRDSSGSVPVYGSSGIVGSHSVALINGPVIIVGRKGNVGAVHYSAVPCWPIDTAYFTEPPIGHDARYYRYLLDSLGLARLDKSTAIPGLSRDDYSAVEVVIHPPEQQAEIVAEIEKQFSRLDEAVANLQRVKANLKRYKASVLKSAVEGHLVGGDAAMAKAHEKGKWLPISLAIKSLDQGWSPQCENEPRTVVQEWAVMRTTAVQEMQFLPDENKRLPVGLEPRSQLELMGGDLLITRAGPRNRVGITCLVKASPTRLMLCDKAYRLRTNLNMALPAYLEVVLNSPTVLDILDEMKSGISDSGLNLTQKRFSELLVPLPSLLAQAEIVAEVDRLLSIVREVEAEVDTNLKRARTLRQATLRSAFNCLVRA
jgi:type I restriction enzyme S subunit